MVKFFRRIRQKLLNTGRIRKYLVYAIGEVLLVMIGILLAFQVNNWNEGKKRIAVERQLLIELKNSLEQEIRFQKWSIKMNKDYMESGQTLLNYLNTEKVYNDSLNVHFHKSTRWIKPNEENYAYENLTKYGSSFLKQDSLEASLHFVFEIGKMFLNTLESRQENYHNAVVVQFLTENFTTSYVSNESSELLMAPIDYNVLKESTTYKNILLTNIERRKADIDYNKERLIFMIEQSLKFLGEELESY